MNVTACVVWFNEEPDTLVRCVTSLSGVADRVVALDGAWRHFPHEFVSSPRDQHDAIRAAAAAAGGFRSVTVMPARKAWRSQVAKRAAVLELARVVGSDWLLVIDADEHVESCDREGLRARLAETPRDVCEVGFRTYGEGVKSTRPVQIRRFYRASTGVTVDVAHNGYRTADGRWLHGDGRHVKREPAADLSDLIKVAHDRDARTLGRQQSRVEFLDARRRLNLERWEAAAVA
jgi:hypothetical protein